MLYIMLLLVAIKSVGGTMADRATLAEPINGRLFFAGEATSRQYPATVHGAFLSGISASNI
mgnify:CR=1 FL=1